MPLQLLPRTAAAFAPRAPPTIVLQNRVEPWLTQSLKRISKVKKPLSSVPQHFQRLTDVLGGELAIWTLTSLLLPKAPESELRKDENPLIEAISNYNMLHIEAYVVHVDMVSQHEVAFKLTKKSIEGLIEYHRDVYSVDAAATLYDWPEKEAQIKKMQEEFLQAANRFVFRTDVRALEGLEDDGAGELLEGRSQDVKRAIMNLFAPLLPPPPRIVDICLPAPAMVHQHSNAGWWQPTMLPPHTMAGDAHWQTVLPSTPSPTINSNCSEAQQWQSWPSISVESNHMEAIQLPSPSPSGSLCDYSPSCDPSQYGSPEAMPMIPTFPFPSQLPQACGQSLGMDMDSMAWGFNPFMTPQYAATM